MRVASVPASHVYVRHLADPGKGNGVMRLSDPVPADGRKVPGGWWPPVMLEPGWVTANRDQFDVFHVHFGFDAIAPDDLRRVVDELERHRKPLIYTVHDLRNPHHRQPTAHDKQQDVLVGAADALITLTPGAARAAASARVPVPQPTSSTSSPLTIAARASTRRLIAWSRTATAATKSKSGVSR